MPLKPTDTILSTRKADPSKIIGRLNGPTTNDIEFSRQLVTWCGIAGVDPVLALVQWLLETADASSPRWTNDLNSSGIGIVSGGTTQPFKVPSVDHSARLHVQCLYSLATRTRHPGIVLWPAADEWFDEVWLPKVRSPDMPDVNTVADLGLRYRDNGVPRATWSFEDGQVPMDTYGKKLASRGREFYPEAPDQAGGSPATPPPPAATTPTTWQGWFDLMFGKGKWSITQDWANDPPGREYDDLYDYGAGHGLDGQKHPGIDVGLAYNTPMYAPAAATVACAGTGVGPGAPDGGCGAYNDTGDKGPGSPKLGVGRIELYFPKVNTSLIFGHSRTAAVSPGQQVTMGQQIGGSGGMYGAHCHLEAVRWGTAQGYTYIDPKILLNQLEQQGGGPPPVNEPVTFGRVPMYGFTDKRAGVADKREGHGWDNLGQRKPKFIVLHRMLGSLDGTDEYFGDPAVAALTDFGVGVESMDGKRKAGWIYMWSDPEGYRSGWASGTVRTPYGDGKKIVDKYGIIAVNRDGVSVEISGNETTAIDDVAWQEIVHLCAWWVDRMKIPYNTRTNPATGANYLIWHEEFTLGTGKKCPFDVVKALTNKLYNDIATYLEPFQTGGVTTPLPVPGTTPAPPPVPEPEPIPEPQYATPMPIPELVEYSDYEADIMKALVTTEGNTYLFVNDIVKAIRPTPRLQTGMVDAPHIGPPIDPGQTFEVTWMFRSTDGRAYYVSPYWSRILVSDTERVSDAA